MTEKPRRHRAFASSLVAEPIPIQPRARAPDVALMMGLSARTVKEMASQGKIPGAAKFGQIWTFDPAKIRALIGRHEALACRETYIVELELAAARPLLRIATTSSAYARMMAGKRPRRPKNTTPADL
jgi:hypothetical protein